MTEGEIVEQRRDRRDLRRRRSTPTPGSSSPPQPKGDAAAVRSDGASRWSRRKDLRVWFPITPRPLPPRRRPHQGRRRRRHHGARGPDARRRRRVRLGQDDARPRAAAAHLVRGPDRLSRHADRELSAGRSHAAAARRHADRLPGPLRLAEPAHVGRRDRRRGARASTTATSRAAERDARVVARPHRSRPRSRRPLPLPARVLRRPAPAHRHRPRHGARAEVRRPRRADLGARHERPGPGRRSPARPAAPHSACRYLFISHDLKVVRALANEIVDHARGQGGGAGAGRRCLRPAPARPTPGRCWPPPSTSRRSEPRHDLCATASILDTIDSQSWH